MLYHHTEKKNKERYILSDKPLISVVTVVYNGEDTIEQTILSVINQTYDNLEYIIIDGGSTDGTIDIIKKYANKIDYWKSEPDKGIYDAMNKGISLANGEWINFMNSGDVFFNEGVINKVFSDGAIQDFDIVYGVAYNYNNNLIQQYKLTILNLLLERMITHQAIFAKKSTFVNNYFDTSYRLIADRIWLYNCIKNKKCFVKLQEPIVYYDMTGVSQNALLFKDESYKFTKSHIGSIGIYMLNIKRFLGQIIRRIHK